jgi:hypothetical protein
MIGIVGLSNVNPTVQTGGAHESLSFRNPFEHGLISSEFLSKEPDQATAPAGPPMDIYAFGRLVAALAFLGWLLEAAITGAVVGFVYRVRPDLVVRGTSSQNRDARGTNGRSEAGTDPMAGPVKLPETEVRQREMSR